MFLSLCYIGQDICSSYIIVHPVYEVSSTQNIFSAHDHANGSKILYVICRLKRRFKKMLNFLFYLIKILHQQ